MILKQALITVVASLSLLGHTYAQPSSSPAKDTGLTLEVVFLKSTPPDFLRVGRTSEKGGAWYGMFGRIAGWQLPKGAPAINAVRLIPYLREETVSVNVSVLRGQYLDTEDKVGSYNVPENEAITLKDLEAFGVEPFVIKVVRASSISDLPTTLNKTKSVAIVGLEPNVGALPSYKIMLHNNSDKNISALSVNIVSQGRIRKSSLPHGTYGEALIKAGGSAYLDRSLAMNAEATAAGFEPAAPSGQQIVIESLVFEDGTYEGEVKPAAQFLSFVVGRRIELKRILPLLKSPPATAEMLRSQITSLSFEADKVELARLTAAFPNLDQAELKLSVDVTIHSLREDLLNRLARQQKSDASAAAFSSWLVRARGFCSDWLSQLDAVVLSAP